jgi:hypothetical protein
MDNKFERRDFMRGVGVVVGTTAAAVLGEASAAQARGDDWTHIGEIALGEDADNIRFDGPDRIIVGYLPAARADCLTYLRW